MLVEYCKEERRARQISLIWPPARGDYRISNLTVISAKRKGIEGSK